MKHLWNKGDKFDLFGDIYEITKVSKDGRNFDTVCNGYKDPFGKIVPKYRRFHLLDLGVVRRLSSNE